MSNKTTYGPPGKAGRTISFSKLKERDGVLIEKFEEKAILQYLGNLLSDAAIYRSFESDFWEWASENRVLFSSRNGAAFKDIQSMGQRRRPSENENPDAVQQKAGAEYLRCAVAKRIKSMLSPEASQLEMTIRAVGDLFTLDQQERDFFALQVRIKKYSFLKDLVSTLAGGRKSKFGDFDHLEIISRLTNVPEEDVATVVSKDGRLLSCGLIEYIQHQDSYELQLPLV